MEDGFEPWNGYRRCIRNKRVVQHVKDPKTGDEYFEVKLNEPVSVIFGTNYCERLRHLYWLRYCNRVGKVAQLRTSLELDQGDLRELLVKAQEGGEEVKS